MGVIFIAIGIIGFAVPDLMGMHLTVGHNLIHLVSGALALYFGLKETPSAVRTFCVVFGIIYALLGVIGFAVGGVDGALTVIPNQLVWGPADHVIHLILGAIFLIGGFYKKPMLTRPTTP
jgi:hypothetical protein